MLLAAYFLVEPRNSFAIAGAGHALARHDGFDLAHELFDRFGVCSLFVSAECAFVPPGACGCGCLQKPFFKDDLLRAVEAALHIAHRDEVPEVKLSGLALWMLPRKSLSGAG